ncbi:hypothetical protein AK812_SmicGene3558 [Symbiodinium microadriaticum]|uniref:Uncharacterized protein n=1 Tax=Symbiodinium microadriaticum TaxID=2951 RepID=A0A1Q9EYK4_SYMMI|nr:hypothetical protein AK812_SmicGene3558 [Symbiodinium microadriaticum]CAE7849111.1 unnamed protein product [Symbiodinium microadriaticum]CAE7922142.1 unnamed protein product [Symbiodinium sp. KB8]
MTCGIARAEFSHRALELAPGPGSADEEPSHLPPVATSVVGCPMFFCCCTEEREGFDAVPVDGSERTPQGLIKSSPALAESMTAESGLYTVQLARGADRKWDLALEKSDVDHLMIKRMTNAVTEWNKNNATNVQISVYDRIVEVNGQRASGKELAKSLENTPDDQVALLLQRPQTRTLILKRPGKLGIIANYMPNYSLKPWIDTIAEGLVRDWNKAHPDASIREHDRILSVNTVSNPPEDVVHQMRKPDADLEIVCLHYPNI